MFIFTFPKNVPKKLNLIKKLGKLNQDYVDNVMEQIAEEAKNRLIGHIEKQDLKWKPLKTEYKAWKEKQGLDPRIWISSGWLKDHVTVINVPEEHLYFIGIDSGVVYPGTNIAVALVAATLEYGSPSRNIPPRPLFRPTRIEMRREIKSFVNNKNKEFIKYLNSL